MRRHSDWLSGPVTFLGLAIAATLVELTMVAQLFADYAQSAAA